VGFARLFIRKSPFIGGDRHLLDLWEPSVRLSAQYLRYPLLCYNETRMTKKQIIIVIVLAIVVLAGIVIGVFLRGEKAPEEGTKTETPATTTSSIPAYSPEVPKDAEPTVPQQAIPFTPGSTESKNKVGTFPITVSASGYSPNSITVNRGDIVTLSLTSQGGTYDMFSSSQGFYVSAPSGATKEISFKATTPGTFGWECREHCPSSGKIQGKLIVLP